MRIHVIDRNGTEHVLDGEEGQPLMQALGERDLVEATCGGACSCATCQVYVGSAWQPRLPAPNAEEEGLISELLNARPNSRLACQIVMTAELDGIEVVVASE